MRRITGIVPRGPVRRCADGPQQEASRWRNTYDPDALFHGRQVILPGRLWASVARFPAFTKPGEIGPDRAYAQLSFNF